MTAMLRHLGGWSYQVWQAPTTIGGKEQDFDPDFDSDFDEEAKQPHPSVAENPLAAGLNASGARDPYHLLPTGQQCLRRPLSSDRSGHRARSGRSRLKSAYPAVGDSRTWKAVKRSRTARHSKNGSASLGLVCGPATR